MKAERFDIHKHITDLIISAIEKGAGKFQLPWRRSAGNVLRPTNIATGNPYRGVNVIALWAESETKGFSSGVWGTYRQWSEAGAQVRRGEKSAFVVFYKQVEIASDDATDDNETRLFARATPVFSADQVDGYKAPEVAAQPAPVEVHATADAFIAATGANIRHGGGSAFYRPSTDTIQVPPQESFLGTPTSTPTEAYYATILHELVHWTAPEGRCGREFGKRFGDSAYAAEELVAELGSAMLCADLHITAEPRPDHAKYLAHWLDVLKADKRAIFTAASKASQAASWLGGERGA